MTKPVVHLVTSDLPQTDRLTQTQREAVIDLLYFCMHADKHLEPVEKDLITEAARMLRWEAAIELESFSVQANERAMAAIAMEEARVAYLNDVAQRLETTEVRSQAIGLCPKMFRVDGDYVTAERAVFGEIRRAFGWPS